MLCFWDLSERRGLAENMNTHWEFSRSRQAVWSVVLLRPCQERHPSTCSSPTAYLPSSKRGPRCHEHVLPSWPWGLQWPFLRSRCGLERSRGALSGHMWHLWEWIQPDRINELSGRAWICFEERNRTKEVSAKNTPPMRPLICPGSVSLCLKTSRLRTGEDRCLTTATCRTTKI